MLASHFHFDIGSYEAKNICFKVHEFLWFLKVDSAIIGRRAPLFHAAIMLPNEIILKLKGLRCFLLVMAGTVIVIEENKQHHDLSFLYDIIIYRLSFRSMMSPTHVAMKWRVIWWFMVKVVYDI